jgi:hypothetical protein
MALTRIKTNQITDSAVTTAKIADNNITAGKLANNLTYGSDFTVSGNLTVSGTTTSVSTTNTRVEDAIIALSAEASGSASVDSGLLINRGSDDNYAFLWDESADKFVVANVGSEDGDTAGNVSISAYANFQALGIQAATVTTSGAINVDATTASSSVSTGALIVDGGAGVAGALFVGGTFDVASGQTVDFNTNALTNVADPSGAQDAATKAYVDSQTSAIDLTLGIGADSGSASTVSTSQTLTISGTSNEIETSVSGQAITIGLPDNVTVGQDLTVTGNLTVNGTTTTISTTNSVVSDNLIELNNGAGSNANDSGIVIERGSTGDNAIFAWDESADVFIVGTTTATGASTGDLTITAAGFTAGAITAASAAIGGGFGSTGVTISSAGVIQANGAISSDGAVTGGSLTDGTATISSGALSGATTGSFSSNVDIADAGSLRVGTGNDFTINHDGTDTTIANGTGILKIDGTATSSIRINEAGANVDFVVEGDSNTGLITVDASQDNVGIGGAPNANAIFDINDTGAMLLARGTTAQRPGTAVTGMFRYNTTTHGIEYYDNSGWESVSSSFTVATSQTFNGDGSTTAFTLATLTGADSYTVAGVLVMLNGVVQEPTTVYGISGVTLTFTTAPASGDLIECRKFTTTTTVTAITDLDGDTQIQTEEGSDDDTIRFDAAGNEIATIGAAGQTINNELALRFAEASGNGSNYIALKAPATVGSNLTFTLPATDGTSGQAMVTDASGNLSFAAAGATISADTSTNTDFLLYFAATTSGALTAVKQDSGLLYNPSTGTLSSAVFSGVATSAQYADLAEMYAADEEIAPGTVVHFAGEGKLAACDIENCRAVAGIVSTDPAYLMNSVQEGVALALAGRVPCKVTGPVAAGDLMVSAGNGMAMANNEAAMGTVIGKAIEANDGGEGVIEVLALMM